MIKDFKLKRGLTLVELLVVISILVIMVGIVAGTLNPIALVNKANDSRRKNDLNKIKIAFEQYYTDKGRYPSKIEVDGWNIEANCGKTISQMKTYLKTLPCDPNKKPYSIIIINPSIDTLNNPSIPKGFKVITNLQNKKDVDIPVDWYVDEDRYNYRETRDEVNYGVSSSNILWYDYSGIDPACGHDCLRGIFGQEGCQKVDNGTCVSGGSTLCFIGSCSGNNLGIDFPPIEKLPQCYVDSCCQGSGCE